MDATTLNELKAAATAVFAGQPVLVAYAFGSRISGIPRADSDLDVAYFSGRPEHPAGLSLGDELGLATALSRRPSVPRSPTSGSKWAGQ